MAQEQPNPPASYLPTSFDQQLWPIQSAIVVLAGCLIGIVLGVADWNDPRLLYNGYTYIGMIVLGASLLMLASTRLKTSSARTAQFCILTSLMLHAAFACVVIRFPLPIGFPDDESAAASDDMDQPDENIAPDYDSMQAEAPDTEQDFQTPVNTKAPESPQALAAVQPKVLDHPMPVTATKPSESKELAAIGQSGAGSPTDFDRFKVKRAKTESEVKPPEPESLAMLHPLGRDIEAPKSEAEMPEAPKADSTKPEKTPQVSDLAQLTDVEGSSRPQKFQPPAVARAGSETGLQLPSDKVVALAPSRELAGGSQRRDAHETTATIDRPASLSRSDRAGLNLPSSVIPDEGLAPKAPAAVGGSSGSRLEKTSSVAVERSPGSHAPQGATTAASGPLDFGSGSNIVPARMGSPDGRGQRRPGSDAFAAGDPAELRSGAASSLLVNGAPLPYAAARRAQASQTEHSGNGVSPGESATLRRSQSPEGIQLPEASLPIVAPVVTGAGGTATNPGGETSRLELGPVATIGRSSAAEVPSQAALSNGNRLGHGAIAEDALPASGSAPRASSVVAMAGLPQSIGRAAAGVPWEEVAPQATVPRAPAANIDPDAKTEDSPGPLRSGAQAASGQPLPLGLATVGGPATVDAPLAAVGGVVARHRAEEPARGLDQPTPTHGRDSTSEGTFLAMNSDAGGPAALRAGASDGDFGHALTGTGPGISRLGRNASGLSLDGAVKEPTEFYRRRAAMRHGLGPGNGDGSGFTEPAVEHGLDFFSRVQFPDGHWSLDKMPEGVKVDSPGLGSYESDTAATGLSLLAYLGAGYTHLDEKHRDVVRRGLEWLIKHQKRNGDLFTGGNEESQKAAQYYSHGIAAMALCEAYGMTQDPDLREPAQKAINFIVNSQDLEHGGWRYHDPATAEAKPFYPLQGSDTSVTGWQLMAMKSAQMAGLDVPDATFRRIGEWLDRARGAEPGTYVYNPWNPETPGRMPSPTMTAEAMLMRMYMGRRRDDPQIVQGADYILAHLPTMDDGSDEHHNAYYWYYATQTMYQMGGKYWKAWNSHVGPLVRAGQVKEGLLEGSWHPTDPVPDRWGSVGGRVYVTSMHLLMLEVYYRHLPLFQELSK